MADPITLQVAAISAGAAIAGAVISQVISLAQSSLDRKHQRRILLRERYEQLAEHISASVAWPEALSHCTSLAELSRSPQPTRARKALTIAAIYFPALQDACQDYINSCANLKIFFIDNYRPGLDGGEVATVVAHRNPNGFQKAMHQWTTARQKVDDTIVALAPIYAQA